MENKIRYNGYFSIANYKLLKKDDIKKLQSYGYVCLPKSDYDNYMRRRIVAKYGKGIFYDLSKKEFRHKAFAAEEQIVLKKIQKEVGFNLEVYKIPGNYNEKHTKCDDCIFKDMFNLCFNLLLTIDEDYVILVKRGLYNNENKQ